MALFMEEDMKIYDNFRHNLPINILMRFPLGDHIPPKKFFSKWLPLVSPILMKKNQDIYLALVRLRIFLNRSLEVWISLIVSPRQEEQDMGAFSSRQRMVEENKIVLSF